MAYKLTTDYSFCLTYNTLLSHVTQPKLSCYIFLYSLIHHLLFLYMFLKKSSEKKRKKSSVPM